MSLVTRLSLVCLCYSVLVNSKRAEHEIVSTERAQHEKSIAAVIPSFNNNRWIERNLVSVLSQEYTNFKVFFIDDHSTDQTLVSAKTLLKKYGYNEQHVQETPLYIKRYFTHEKYNAKTAVVIENKHRRGAFENLWRAIHLCEPTDIVATIDGDDWLIDNQVFKKLNSVYSNPQKPVWLTYGQFQLYPSGERGWCTKMPEYIIKQNAYRKHPHIPSHLRTFYAGLFQQVPLKDLVNHDGFYAMAWDIPLMMIIEKAGERHHFFEDPLYVYNEETPLNDHKINKQLQSYLAKLLRAKEPYGRLEELNTSQYNQKSTVDLVVFSENNPLLLRALLESVRTYVKGLSHIQVLYTAQDMSIETAYKALFTLFPEITVHRVNTKIPYYIKYCAPRVIADITSDYILLASDGAVITDTVDLSVCIRALQKTGAYGFYLRVGQNITCCYPYPFEQQQPKLLEVDPDIYAWVFYYSAGDWAYPGNLECTLYPKAEIMRAVKSGHYANTESLEVAWGSTIDFTHVGLCFTTSKAVKVKLTKDTREQLKQMGYTPGELLSFVEQGLKLDLAALTKSTSAARVEWIPQFVKL